MIQRGYWLLYRRGLELVGISYFCAWLRRRKPSDQDISDWHEKRSCSKPQMTQFPRVVSFVMVNYGEGFIPRVGSAAPDGDSNRLEAFAAFLKEDRAGPPYLNCLLSAILRNAI